ncbi:DMT family transporter [Rickettsiales endosymbiont of Stachyamoeba lipophora]|nr:DMT family transporter [Rickettsiales endosymbiont of Stachyamoeba lipophora]AZL15105.1 EamA family transporter [Rickettsiales endosymbiont of Stachyamoeba lipophora]
MNIITHQKAYNKALLYALLSAFFYGLMAFFAIKLHQKNIPVETVLFWRFATAIIILILFNPKKILNVKCYKDKQYLVLLFISLICLSGSSFLFYTAATYIGSGLAITIFFSFPLFVIAYARIIDKQKIQKDVFISIILILTGLTLIHENNGPKTNHGDLGVILAIISGFYFGSYIFFSKKYASKVDSYNASTVTCFGTLISFTAFNLIKGNNIALAFNIEIWTYIFCIAFFVLLLHWYFSSNLSKYYLLQKSLFLP